MHLDLCRNVNVNFFFLLIDRGDQLGNCIARPLRALLVAWATVVCTGAKAHGHDGICLLRQACKHTSETSVTEQAFLAARFMNEKTPPLGILA